MTWTALTQGQQLMYAFLFVACFLVGIWCGKN
jgi:hypothetical protein